MIKLTTTALAQSQIAVASRIVVADESPCFPPATKACQCSGTAGGLADLTHEGQSGFHQRSSQGNNHADSDDNQEKVFR